MLNGRKTGSHSAGALLSDQQTKVLRRYLPRIVDQRNGLNRSIRVLIENQRGVAKNHTTVGLDAQCVFIPRNPLMPGHVISNLDGTEMPTNNCSFGFFDADGFAYKQIGPLLAHGGFVLDQFQGTADPKNPDNQRIGFRHLKVPQSWLDAWAAQVSQSGGPSSPEPEPPDNAPPP